MALYTNNQDSGMNVACTGSCAAIWVPLMAPSSGQPTSSDQAVQTKLGTVKSKGGSQVTFGGMPLYTFVQDSPGQVTGNGFTDNFGGTSFTWTVASTGAGVLALEQHEQQQLERQQLRRLERRLRLLAQLAAEASSRPATARSTNCTISSVGAPGVNTSATPSFLSSGMSSAGIVPPTVTTTSLAP